MDNIPKSQPQEVLNYITRNWDIFPEEGLILSRVTKKSLETLNTRDYVQLNVGGFATVKRAHVIYWAYHGYWPDTLIDYWDRNRSNDKRLLNLLDPKWITHIRNC